MACSMRTKSIHGFGTCDLVLAAVPKGKNDQAQHYLSPWRGLTYFFNRAATTQDVNRQSPIKAADAQPSGAFCLPGPDLGVSRGFR